MEENKNDTMARIDELLESTSAENRIKFNEDDAIDELSRQETEPAVESAEPFAQNIETVALLVRNISTKEHVVIEVRPEEPGS